MIKVGVIGYGFSASVFHLPLLEVLNGFELCALSSSQKDKVKSDYPNVKVYDKAEDLIRHSDVDLVIITAPNDVHYPLAKLCLENNKHVVLEKPMATTASEADELNFLAVQNKKVLSVFHNRRWDGDFLTVKKLIEEDKLGDIRFFESHFDRYRPDVKVRWKELPGPGGGVWFDLGAHLIDQALELFGLPNAVTGRCIALRDHSQATDYFHVMLHYPNREIVLHSSPYTAGPNMRFHIQGTKASYIKYGLDPQEDQLKGGVSPNEPDFGYEAEEYFGTLYHGTSRELIETCKGNYIAYYSELAEAICEGKRAPVSGESAASVIKLLELAEMSSMRGETLCVNEVF